MLSPRSSATSTFSVPISSNYSGSFYPSDDLRYAIEAGTFTSYSYNYGISYADTYGEIQQYYSSQLANQAHGDLAEFLRLYADYTYQYNTLNVFATFDGHEMRLKQFSHSAYYDPTTIPEYQSIANGSSNILLTDADRADVTLNGDAYFKAAVLIKIAIDNGYHVRGFTTRYSSINLTMTDTTAPTIKSVTATQGVYYPGEVVPIRVVYSEPVQKNARLTVNGRTLSPLESSAGNVLTFPYTVGEIDNATITVTNASMTDLCGLTKNGYPNGSAAVTLSGVSMQTPLKSKAITGFSATTSGNAATPKIDVEVKISSNDDETEWLDSQFVPNSDGTFTCNALKVSADGENFSNLISNSDSVTGKLTASLDVPPLTGEDPVDYTVEL